VALGHILLIARQTFTEARRNKVFYSLFFFALIVVLNATIFTEVTFATMDRVLKDTGIAAINIYAIALTIFIGIGIVNREIDRRSIYAILAKPIPRYVFILGRYTGLMFITLITSGIMFVCLLGVMKSYRAPINLSMLVGFVGILIEVAVIGALAILCSTFSNSMVSAFITVAVWVSGHISGEAYIFTSRSVRPLVRAIGDLSYFVVPNLERFNFKVHVTYGALPPAGALGAAVGYGVTYAAAFLIAAVLIFSRRDLR
jgi:ABC-type transport system involved in multi-copper enzyme maturation permease subunit